MKNNNKYIIDFSKGCALCDNKAHTLFLNKKGCWFRKGIKRIYLTEYNCEF